MPRSYPKNRIKSRSKFGEALYDDFFIPNDLTEKRLAEKLAEEKFGGEVFPSVLNDMVTGRRFAYDPAIYDDLYAILTALAELCKDVSVEMANDLLKTIQERNLSKDRRIQLLTRLIQESVITPSYRTLQQTLLIGRDEVIKAIYAQLQNLQKKGVRILTLIGTPGVGKTELAQQIRKLAQTLEYFPQVCLPISLEEVTNVDIVLSMIDKHLEGLDPQERTLIVLDNCELIKDIEKASERLYRCLAEHNQLTILATSQVQFSDIKQCFRVEPLTVPSSQYLSLGELEAYDAIKLFLELTKGNGEDEKDFMLTEGNARNVAALCIGLGGLPLALRIAALLVKSLGIEKVIEKVLDRSIQEIDAPPPVSKRQETLLKLFDMSYGLLNPRKQTLFRRLAVFSGRCNLAEVAAVCSLDSDVPANEDDPDLINFLNTLSRHNLITFVNNQVQIAHNTIRDYAMRKLVKDKEEAVKITEQFINYYYTIMTEILIDEYNKKYDMMETANRFTLINWNHLLSTYEAMIYIIYDYINNEAIKFLGKSEYNAITRLYHSKHYKYFGFTDDEESKLDALSQARLRAEEELEDLFPLVDLWDSYLPPLTLTKAQLMLRESEDFSFLLHGVMSETVPIAKELGRAISCRGSFLLIAANKSLPQIAAGPYSINTNRRSLFPPLTAILSLSKPYTLSNQQETLNLTSLSTVLAKRIEINPSYALQTLPRLLNDILLIIEYKKDREAYIQKFINLLESQAFIDCLSTLSLEKQDELAERMEGVEDKVKIMELFKDYIPGSLYREKLRYASQKQLHRFFSSVIPTLRADQKENLVTFFHSLEDYPSLHPADFLSKMAHPR